MNEIFNFNGQEVRTVTINNEPYFVGKDVANILGYERPTKAIQDHVDDEDKDAIPIQDSIGRKQNTPIINESGLYSLILSSKLPQAKEFKRWVTTEVLPTIRKHGAYLTDSKIVFINYEGFRLFVKLKSRNRYRPKKETLAEMLKNIEIEQRLQHD